MGIIIKPIVTEKQTAITEKMANRYGFRVSPSFNVTIAFLKAACLPLIIPDFV